MARRRPRSRRPLTAPRRSRRLIEMGRVDHRNRRIFTGWCVLCLVTSFALGLDRPVHAGIALAIGPVMLVALGEILVRRLRRLRQRDGVAEAGRPGDTDRHGRDDRDGSRPRDV